MRTDLFIVFLLCALTVKAQPPAADNLVVELKNGRIRGEYVTVKGSEQRVRQYLGIPFAQPPVGALRFTAPQMADKWEGEKNCTQQPPMCIQDHEIVVNMSRFMLLDLTPPDVSEDCLYLNVYTPAEASTSNKLPVMVWIHGGGLMIGAASQYDGAPLAAYENIVIVVIQYRLGILGFLSTNDEHARGNWGLLDQVAALRWVQENIEAFGGDPQAVTVAGESAGGISASILTLSPKAKGLFQRAIFQSGVATLGDYTSTNTLRSARIIAQITGCNHTLTEEIVRCMRGKSKEVYITASKQLRLFLGATVDGDFLLGKAEELLKKKEVLNIPVMMGVTNHEFGWILPQSFAPAGWEKGMTRESVLPVVKIFSSTNDSVAGLIRDEYLKDAKTPEEIRDAFTEVIGDLLMALPVVKAAGYHTDAGAPVYLYEFAHIGSHYKKVRPSFVKADHADDVGYMFGACFWNGFIKIIGNITEEDKQVCRTMMSYWANFVRSGSPNGPGLVSWPLYDREKQEYMELTLTPSVKQKLKQDRLHFMAVILPQRLEELERSQLSTDPPEPLKN